MTISMLGFVERRVGETISGARRELGKALTGDAKMR
jgi:hypothetical protein